MIVHSAGGGGVCAHVIESELQVTRLSLKSATNASYGFTLNLRDSLLLVLSLSIASLNLFQSITVFTKNYS